MQYPHFGDSTLILLKEEGQESSGCGTGGGVRTPRVVEIEGYILRLFPTFIP